MDHLERRGMKGPIRAAPSVPTYTPTRYSPVTNWNDDPFSPDVFASTTYQQKKKPPPRPPPPKLKPQPDVPNKPSHFMRRPTILTNLMSKKDKKKIASMQQQSINEINNDNMKKIFAKCEVKNVKTASLIDLSSPPSSPTFTTRSSSDGLSVDSFGSDATSSTNHNRVNNGNQSQAESGFEDDFDLFLSSRRIVKDDTMDDFANFDPFSPPRQTQKKVVPMLNDSALCNGKTIQPAVQTHKVPTIIRAKPARPKPPESAALLKSSFTPTVNTMKFNLSTPIDRINVQDDIYSVLPSVDWSPAREEREASPPMPTVPPPPPPLLDEADLSEPDWEDRVDSEQDWAEPYAVALYDYSGDHADDLCFQTNTKIKLIRRMDKEWLMGRLQCGTEGIFPANYVEIRVPLPGETIAAPTAMGRARALYDLHPTHAGDLRLAAGDEVTVITKINEEWYVGECRGAKGQFPANYVQMY